MDNESIARRFYRLAALMEIRGDDPFRLRSYRNAAEALETWPTSLEKVWQGCWKFPEWEKRSQGRSSI